MMNQRGGSRTDTLIKLVLIFFVSLLSFSVGTYVGKQVSDSDHRRAQLEGGETGMGVAEHGAADANSSEQGKEERLSEDEIASLTEEFVKSDKEIAAAQAQNGATGEVEAEAQREVASAPAEAPSSTPAAAGYKKYSPPGDKPKADATPQPKAEPKHEPKEHREPSAAAARVAEGKAPLDAPKEARKPQSVLPSVAGTAVGKFTVQVASYATEGEAKNHAAELTTKGWNAFYIPADVQGRTWYRVSVGLFNTSKSATEFRQEFQKESGVATAIVQKIVN